MNFKLKMPDMLAEARKYGGKNVFLEILIFIGFFLLAQLVVGIAAGIVIGVYVAVSGLLNSGVTPQDLPAKFMQLNMLLSLFFQILGIFLLLGLCKWIQKRKGWTLGFKKRNMFREYGIGMLAGFFMMTAAVVLGWITGALKIRFNPEAMTAEALGLLVLYLIGFMIQGMNEEVLCRGYFLLSLSRKKGNLWMGIIVSSLAFSALHLGNPGITLLSLLNLTLFGIFAGFYFVKRGDLWGIGALHSLWNFTQGNVWGVLVSGLKTDPSVFVTEANPGMALLNGGRFGLEGGLIVTVILILGILILGKVPQKDFVKEAQISEIAQTEL